jgi:hypothetical protein
MHLRSPPILESWVHVAQTFVLFLGYSTILFLVCFFNSVAMVLSAIHRMMVISYRFAVFTRFFKSLHLDIFVTWMHSFPLIFSWSIYQNVSNSQELWSNIRRYDILHTLNLGCSFITLRDLDVILHGFMLQIIFTTDLIVLYYVCSIGIYYNVNGF